MLEPFPRCHHCPVVFEYVLQFADDYGDEVEEVHVWSKGDCARLPDSPLVFYQWTGCLNLMADQ